MLDFVKRNGWLFAVIGFGFFVVMTITVFVDVVVLGPTDSRQSESSNRDGIQQQVVTGSCESVQERIDALGRPGWDGLPEDLQSEIEQLSGECTFIGDEKAF